MGLGIGVELGTSAINAAVVESRGQGIGPLLSSLSPTRIKGLLSKPTHEVMQGLHPEKGAGGEASQEAVKLLAAHTFPCDTSNADSLARALRELRQRLEIIRPITIGLPGTASVITTVTPLIANRQRAELAVAFELQQQLPFDISRAAWHYHWLSPVSARPASLRSVAERAGFAPSSTSAYLSHSGTIANSDQEKARHSSPSAVVAALRRRVLDEKLASCRRAGLPVEVVAVNPLALLNAWQARYANADDSAVALLHFVSAQLAEWILWDEHALQVVPVALSPENTTQANERWLDIAVSWQALCARSRQLPGKVWLVNPPSDSAEREALGAALRIPVESFEELRVSSLTEGFSSSAGHVSVVAFGLAVQSAGAAKVPLNLIAGVVRAARAQRIRRNSAIVAGICVLGIIGLTLGVMVGKHFQRARVLSSLERTEQLYHTLRPQIKTLLREQNHMQRHLEQLKQQVVGHAEATRWFARIAQVLPREVWLTKMEGERKGALFEGALEGRAHSFPDVDRTLERLQGIDGVNKVKLLSTNIITDALDGSELIEFSAQIRAGDISPEHREKE